MVRPCQSVMCSIPYTNYYSDDAAQTNSQVCRMIKENSMHGQVLFCDFNACFLLLFFF